MINIFLLPAAPPKPAPTPAPATAPLPAMLAAEPTQRRQVCRQKIETEIYADSETTPLLSVQ